MPNLSSLAGLEVAEKFGMGGGGGVGHMATVSNLNPSYVELLWVELSWVRVGFGQYKAVCQCVCPCVCVPLPLLFLPLIRGIEWSGVPTTPQQAIMCLCVYVSVKKNLFSVFCFLFSVPPMVPVFCIMVSDRSLSPLVLRTSVIPCSVPPPHSWILRGAFAKENVLFTTCSSLAHDLVLICLLFVCFLYVTFSRNMI